MGFSLFIEYAESQPLFFFSVVVTVVVSIVLHELSHGAAAIWQGDRTPIERGHMTLNPIVHMGWISLVMLAVAGIAWGLMPINPYRFRSRYGDAMVAAAGPLMNLILAAIALTGLGLWFRFAFDPTTGASALSGKVIYFVETFGEVNLVLFLFNLIPIPPLDGSRILATFSRPYAQLLNSPNRQGVMAVLFVVVFLAGGYLYVAATKAAGAYLGWLMML